MKVRTITGEPGRIFNKVMPRLTAVVAMLVSLSGAWAATINTLMRGASAETPDSLVVSVLTCSPGKEVYELCGHSAIRIREYAKGAEEPRLVSDSIWNYGIFDFNQPNFVYRFVKGETDYKLGSEPTERFLPQYYYRGSSVTEQELNFKQSEALRLQKLLQENALPQNRTYRYNYVKENCATSIKDKLAQAAEADIVYPDSVKYGTFRKEMRAWHAGYPWYQFGIDLALGPGLDYRLKPDEEMFVPVVMKDRIEGARMSDGRRLVRTSYNLFDGFPGAVLPPTPWYLTPLFWGCVAFALALLTGAIDVRRRRATRIVYALWFALCGLGGSIIAFLVFISAHEASSPNMLIYWLNPLMLLVPIFIWSRRTRWIVVAEMVLAAICTAFVLLSWPLQPQSGNAAFFPLMGATIVLAVAYLTVELMGKNVKSGKKVKKKRGNGAKSIVIATLVCAGGCGVAYAAPVQEQARPRLVLGIVVDQLRTDRVEQLQGLFGPGGFNLAKDSGVYFPDVENPVRLADAVNSTVMFMTGEYPSRNGVSAAYRYNATTRNREATLADEGSYSAKNIGVSTLVDEVVIDGAGLGLSYSIAADAQMAVALAGHASTGAFWIDENTGRWSTSPYYKGMPSTLTNRNHTKSIAVRIDTMTWRPMLKAELYPGIPKQHKYYPFGYTFPRSDRNVYKMVAASPVGNREVTELAIECLKDMRLGKRGDAIDVLNVGYTVAPYPYSTSVDGRMEQQDAYLRLDADISRLIAAVQREVGLENALIYIVSTGYATEKVEDAERYKIPGGEISAKRMGSLLASWLSAKFGNGDYVEGVSDCYVYLNGKTIESKRLDYGTVAAEARDFMTKVSGVSEAYITRDIMGSTAREHEGLRHAINPKDAGDIYFEVMPGWVFCDDMQAVIKKRNTRRVAVNTPAYMIGCGLEPRVVEQSVEIIRLAPTITSVLGTDAPNAARLKPIWLCRKK